MIASERALAALASLPPQERLDAAAHRLAGGPGGPLRAFAIGTELAPEPARLDGRLLEVIAARALDGTRGAVFTGAREARLLAALPDPEHISTTHVERQNLWMRMGMRRFTRLTIWCSKKLENHAHAVAPHFMHFNFCRIHKTLRVTPTKAAGVTDHVWNIEEVVTPLDAAPTATTTV